MQLSPAIIDRRPNWTEVAQPNVRGVARWNTELFPLKIKRNYFRCSGIKRNCFRCSKIKRNCCRWREFPLNGRALNGIQLLVAQFSHYCSTKFTESGVFIWFYVYIKWYIIWFMWLRNKFNYFVILNKIWIVIYSFPISFGAKCSLI